MKFRDLFLFVTIILGLQAPLASGQNLKVAVPGAPEIAELLKREPITVESWPVWRTRLLSWMPDRSRKADAAYEAARDFARRQADEAGNLRALSDDALVWYLLGSSYLTQRKEVSQADAGLKAETALRKSLALDPSFARTHRNLALAIASQAPPDQEDPRAREIDQELAEAQRLDPALPMADIKGHLAMVKKQYAQAEQYFGRALEEDPQDSRAALGMAAAIVQSPTRAAPFAPPIQKLVDRFPDDAQLACLHALALARDNRAGAAAKELKRARALGLDPAQFLGPQLVQAIEDFAAPGLAERFAWIMLYFAAFYVVVMLLMSLAGLLLARQTRGDRALGLLQDSPDHLVDEGQVVRMRGETTLARLYALALIAGLVLFYVSIPFVIVGLLGTTLALVYLIFMVGQIPIKLVVIIIVLGLGGAWAVLKSLFTRAAVGGFGLPTSASDCPRLYQVIGDVARRVDTDPVDDVYVSPGAEIGVHQEGRGPFGIFGVKRRVLTLGFSALQFLTVSELEAILAHEYAHFSHSDTFYGRFIYQVHISIAQALWGMGQAGGKLNYINPFYWFLFLYFKSYSLLSAGFSRSREFLADRMASSLYGPEVFTTALTKVVTKGAIFEKTMYENVAGHLEKEPGLVNLYQALHGLQFAEYKKQDFDEEYEQVLAEKGSLFAQHPTIAERLAAVADLPSGAKKDNRPALTLFDNSGKIEQDLTRFMASLVFGVPHASQQPVAEVG